ncbi:unnamed protein product, partial [Laminaria digitata]
MMIHGVPELQQRKGKELDESCTRTPRLYIGERPHTLYQHLRTIHCIIFRPGEVLARPKRAVSYYLHICFVLLHHMLAPLGHHASMASPSRHHKITVEVPWEHGSTSVDHSIIPWDHTGSTVGSPILFFPIPSVTFALLLLLPD